MSREHSPDRSTDHEHSERITFEQSARQLLALADAQPKINPGFTLVSLDADDAPQFQEYKTVSIAATGARREFRYGEFYQAQLLITSEGETDALIWCPTDASRVEMPIQVNDQVLREFGLMRLTKTNAAIELGEKASTLDDYDTLLRIMQELDVPIPAELLTTARRALRQEVVPKTLRGEKPDLQKVFNFISLYAEMNRSVPYGLQSELAQILLRQIDEVTSWGHKPSETSEEASEYIFLALFEEVITYPQALQKILTSPQIYQFDFASEILDMYLHSETEQRRKGWIFSTRELSFIRDYTSVLLKTHTSSTPPRDVAQLHEVIQRIPDHVPLHMERRTLLKEDLQILMMHFPTIFRTICNERPKADLRVRNVETILTSLLASARLREKK